ncbi:hypothetical protein C9374_008251 [Naegleria lovaniensis]|uniref:Ankyrin repeat-containing protein n=1 Tax=Naegleria lovaniensis TaxID=51637 RepID=A0AA88KFT4_NAELO|nr:uncharacterized protein C9374_008251 [Naegleria lovaniensis]KAG2378612.1 hypothetical protein C9374_008251 [Naegleria lovaniensis]
MDTSRKYQSVSNNTSTANSSDSDLSVSNSPVPIKPSSLANRKPPPPPPYSDDEEDNFESVSSTTASTPTSTTPPTSTQPSIYLSTASVSTACASSVNESQVNVALDSSIVRERQQRNDLLHLFEIEDRGDSQRLTCTVEYVDDYLLRISQQVRIPRYSHKKLPPKPPMNATSSPTSSSPTSSVASPYNEDDQSSIPSSQSTDALDRLEKVEEQAADDKPTRHSLVASRALLFQNTGLSKFAKPRAPSTLVRQPRNTDTNTSVRSNRSDTSFVTHTARVTRTESLSPTSTPSNLLTPPPVPPKSLKPKRDLSPSTPEDFTPSLQISQKIPSPLLRQEESKRLSFHATPTPESKVQREKIPRERVLGPHVIDFVTQLTFPNHSNCYLVHLAAKYNHVDILHWLLDCCCDETCPKSPSTPSTDALEIPHSKKCISRQKKLWSLQDKQGMTPLYYSVAGNDIGQKTQDACVFLCSQSIVQEKQLNFLIDPYGNLPIVLALKRKDLELADMLQLFGAKLDITVGIGVLGESLLHSAFRDCDVPVSEYIIKAMPRLIFKKNQREEHALFACLRDYRSINTHSSNSSSNLLELTERKTYSERRQSSLVFTNTSTSLNNNNKYFLFLKHILVNGNQLFGVEIFEKALLMKNAFGNNILMQAVAFNDVDSFKTICRYLFEYSMKQVEKHKLLTSMALDRDRDGRTILHLSIDFAIKMLSKKPEDFLAWFNGFEWLFVWLEQNFLCLTNNVQFTKSQSLHSFLMQKDNSGKTVFDMVAMQDIKKTEWKSIKESLQTAADKWIQNKPVSGTGSALEASEASEKQSLVSLFKNKMKKSNK